MAARAVGRGRVFTAGMQTAVGRDLQRTTLQRVTELSLRWSVTVRLVDWTDPTAGLADGSSDVAFVWLPLPGDGLRCPRTPVPSATSGWPPRPVGTARRW
jgi:hypothetical protein